MESGARTRLVALAVLLAISVPLVVIAAAGGGGDEQETGGLRVERTPAPPGLTVYVEDPKVNALETTGGEERVEIECVDENGTVVFSKRKPWPFSDTDGGIFDPHVHITISSAAVVDRISRCRLAGTDPPLAGEKV
jgi:hypothetical protein